MREIDRKLPTHKEITTKTSLMFCGSHLPGWLPWRRAQPPSPPCWPQSPRPLCSISVLCACRSSSARKAEWERSRSCSVSTSSHSPRSKYFISSKPKLVSISNFCSSATNVATRLHDSVNVTSRSRRRALQACKSVLRSSRMCDIAYRIKQHANTI